MFTWETEPGFAVHILTCNDPNMMKPSLRKTYPIGKQEGRMELPDGVRIANSGWLRVEKDLPFHQKGTIVKFVILSADDFKMAALYKA